VIVYEFAMRFLMGENWRPIPFTPPAPGPAPEVSRAAPSPPPESPAPKPVEPVEPASPQVAQKQGPITVIAQVVQTSKVPAPGTAPYKDCLTYVKLRIERLESGRFQGSEVVGAFWAMKDDVWLPAASYTVGDRLRLTMIPIEQADRQTQTLQRADDLNDFTTKVFFVTSEVRE
jgi:hypothetical protein